MADSKRYISKTEFETHKKPDDLWISIQGKIYNVTQWSHHHPGGPLPLLNLAGQDATDAFIAYHPGIAWQYLDKFFTGYYLEGYLVSDISEDYRKLAVEFSKMGLFDKKGHGTCILLTIIALLFFTCVYGVLCCDKTWVHLCCGGLMGFLWIQSGWIGHDSGHYTVMSNKNLNRLAQLLTGNCLAGISMGWWKWTHNAHHIACNSLDFDPDLQHMPFFTFCLNHFSSSVYVGPPNGNDWFEKQTDGTLNILCSSWMDWFYGGLQFQVEHHLFPRLPRCHLRTISPFVKELCKKHNLAYNCASFWKANAMTIETLKSAALQARVLTNAVPKNLVWEAVNTHG
ncbi:hypothetical protein V6Z12_D08G298400 [Gossypium hirsutum]